MHDANSIPPVFKSPLSWLTLFGPGAIVASLTIGTGELIFSSRGGALFGYDILSLFVLISVLKWGLVIGLARHFVISGVHPYQRLMHLPGPRGWLLLVILLILSICMPIWVSFHCAVLGNLSSWITGTSENAGADYVWGGLVLAAILTLSALGGYSVLERVQLFIVGALMVCAALTLLLYNPDWLAMLRGLFLPDVYEYPEWVNEGNYPEIAEQTVFIETTRYVGVIGGAAFDYLAYTSWLRDKRWGRAGAAPATERELVEMANDPNHPVRLWVKAPYVDCTISFLLIVVFSAVFVAAGAMFLGPNQKVPDEANLLNLQAEFVTTLHPWLLPLYVSGAFLTMLGTAYGTLEVANAAFRELAFSANVEATDKTQLRWRRMSTAWCAVGALIALTWMCVHQLRGAEEKPRILIDILTPANLFTGVFSCGYLCLLLPWMDWRFLPPPLRMPAWLMGLNILAGLIFLLLGLRGYWEDPSRWLSIGTMAALTVIAILICSFLERSSGRSQGDHQ